MSRFLTIVEKNDLAILLERLDAEVKQYEQIAKETGGDTGCSATYADFWLSVKSLRTILECNAGKYPHALAAKK